MTVGTPGNKARQYRAALLKAAETAMRPLEIAEHPLRIRVGAATRAELDAYDEIVALTGTAWAASEATMGTNSSREYDYDATIVFSVHRRGSDDDGEGLEAEAADRILILCDALEERIRVTDRTLGGVVRKCIPVSGFMSGESDPQVIAVGRTQELSVVFRAPARVVT